MTSQPINTIESMGRLMSTGRGSRTKELWADPEYRKMMSIARSKGQKKRFENPEERIKHSNSMRAACSRPEVKERKSEAQRRNWANPDYREKTSNILKEALSKSEVKSKRIRSQKKVFAKPESKRRRSKATKESWANPESRARRCKKIKEKLTQRYEDPKERDKISKATQETWADPEIRARRIQSIKIAQNRPEVKAKKSGPNASNWKGGKSFEPYCLKFNNKLKEEIRANFGHKCFLCPHIQNGRKLSIHHVDYDKNDLCNGKKWPLIPLCTKCHGKTNYNRYYWFNLLLNYWAMNPEINFTGGDLFAH